MPSYSILLHAANMICYPFSVACSVIDSTNGVARSTLSSSLACLFPWCRRWPTVHSFQPEQLNCVTSATVDQLVTNNCKVLWAPAASRTRTGKWVAVCEALLVKPADFRASAVVTAVGRRAGLQIPEAVPDHVFKVNSRAHNLHTDR